MQSSCQAPKLSLVPQPSPGESRGARTSAPGSSAGSPKAGALSGNAVDLVDRHERLAVVKDRAIRHWRQARTLEALDRRFARCLRLMDAVARSRVDLSVLVWKGQEVARV